MSESQTSQEYLSDPSSLEHVLNFDLGTESYPEGPTQTSRSNMPDQIASRSKANTGKPVTSAKPSKQPQSGQVITDLSRAPIEPRFKVTEYVNDLVVQGPASTTETDSNTDSRGTNQVHWLGLAHALRADIERNGRRPTVYPVHIIEQVMDRLAGL